MFLLSIRENHDSDPGPDKRVSEDIRDFPQTFWMTKRWKTSGISSPRFFQLVVRYNFYRSHEILRDGTVPLRKEITPKENLYCSLMAP